MKPWKRAPRKFEVTIGDPWTINGKETEHKTSQAVLQEIYDIAVYFPIVITVTGTEISFSLEMDEHMRTRSLDSAVQTPTSEDPDQGPHEEIDPTETGLAVLSGALESEEETTDLAHHADNDPGKQSKKFWPRKVAPRTLGIAAGAVVGLTVVGLVVAQLLGSAASNASANESQITWESPIPESSPAAKSLDSKYDRKIWTLEPGEADSVSWFAAGIVATDEDKGEISLYSQTDGKRLATHKIGDGVTLPKDLRWAAEFMHGGEAAVGLRIADTFVGISAKGQIQKWTVPVGMDIKVHGTTPVMTNAATEKDPTKVIYKALSIGDRNPINLTPNPQLTTRAVDGNWIIQVDLEKPLVAMNPVDRSNKKTPAQAISLEAPTNEAIFVRHLDAGHGNALALWRVGEELYVGVHPLMGDEPGVSASFVKAPFPEEGAKNWNIASGMELALLGPYAFSLDTGELAEFNKNQDFTRAYGPVAVAVDNNNRRTFFFENTEYAETARIIGFTGQGTILVRLIDGSIAAYGESGGLA